jgi:toxin ParE1/3/4
LPTSIRFWITLPQFHPLAQCAFKKRIQDVIELLPAHPDFGIRTDDPVIRRLTTPPYPFLVLYEVTEKEVVIHAVRHAARNPAGMPGSA